jgi:DHA1 family multidrug resistance protein-like MFS transporter
MMGFTFVFPFVPLFIQKELGIVSVREVALWAGAAGAATGIALAVSSPIWGAVADRHGRKPMVIRAMVGGGLTLAAIALVTNVQQFLVLRFVQGALSGTVAASTALVATEAPRDRVSQSLGVLQSSIFIGAAAGPLLGGIVSAAVGLRGSFAVGGALLVSAGLLVWHAVRENFHRELVPARQPYGLRALGRPALALIVVLGLVQVGTTGAFPLLPLLVVTLTPANGASTSFLAGVLFGAAALAATAGALLYSRLTNRFRFRQVLIGAALGGGAFAMLQGAAANYLQLLLASALAGAFQGVIVPLINLMLGQEVPLFVKARAFGVGASATALGGAAGPLLGAGMAASFGLRWAITAVGAILVLMAGWIAITVREPPAPAPRREEKRGPEPRAGPAKIEEPPLV